MRERNVIDAEVRVALDALREHAAVPLHGKFVRLLDLMTEQVADEMLKATPDKLASLQIAGRQIKCLRDAITVPHGSKFSPSPLLKP